MKNIVSPSAVLAVLAAVALVGCGSAQEDSSASRSERGGRSVAQESGGDTGAGASEVGVTGGSSTGSAGGSTGGGSTGGGATGGGSTGGGSTGGSAGGGQGGGSGPTIPDTGDHCDPATFVAQCGVDESGPFATTCDADVRVVFRETCAAECLTTAHGAHCEDEWEEPFATLLPVFSCSAGSSAPFLLGFDGTTAFTLDNNNNEADGTYEIGVSKLSVHIAGLDGVFFVNQARGVVITLGQMDGGDVICENLGYQLTEPVSQAFTHCTWFTEPQASEATITFSPDRYVDRFSLDRHAFGVYYVKDGHIRFAIDFNAFPLAYDAGISADGTINEIDDDDLLCLQ